MDKAEEGSGPPEREEPFYLRFMVPFVGYVVTLAWAVSFFIGLLEPHYVPPASLQGLMMVVAGSTFALPVLRNRGKPQ